MDGGNDFYTFFSILLPMAKGPFTALLIMVIITKWNDYMSPLLYLDKMPTLATGLYYYRETLRFESNEPVYFAGVLMSMLPILILFAAFQEVMMGSVVAGGLKG